MFMTIVCDACQEKKHDYKQSLHVPINIVKNASATYVVEHAIIIIVKQSMYFRFLSRVSILTPDIDTANLSVRLSVTFRYQMKTAQHIVIVFSPYGSLIILVLLAANIFAKFRPGQPAGALNTAGGIKISRFSTNKSLYLANDTGYRHSYYGRRIGTRM